MKASPEATNPMQQVLQVATGYIASSAMSVAMELGIPDRLTAGPRSAAELAQATGANEDALYRVLRLLASLGIFEEVGQRRFGLNEAGQLLCAETTGSLGGVARFLPDPLHFRVYANLVDSVRTGRPAAEKTLGMPVFEYLAANPDYSEVFNDAMTAMSGPAASAAIEAYDFSRYPTIVDVAGGHGEVLMAILRACPGSRGVVADLEHVIQGTRKRIAEAGMAERCQAVTCDFFRAVPEGGDAYVMKHIIHDWDDDRAATILENIKAAMGEKKSALILIETVVPDEPGPDMSKVIDLEMMAFPGGRERTRNEFGELFDRAGFELTKVVATKSPFSVIEAVGR